MKKFEHLIASVKVREALNSSKQVKLETKLTLAGSEIQVD